MTASALVEHRGDVVVQREGIERARLGDEERVARRDFEAGGDPDRLAQVRADREDSHAADEGNGRCGREGADNGIGKGPRLGQVRDRHRNGAPELFGRSNREARQRRGARRPRHRVRRVGVDDRLRGGNVAIDA